MYLIHIYPEEHTLLRRVQASPAFLSHIHILRSTILLRRLQASQPGLSLFTLKYTQTDNATRATPKVYTPGVVVESSWGFHPHRLDADDVLPSRVDTSGLFTHTQTRTRTHTRQHSRTYKERHDAAERRAKAFLQPFVLHRAFYVDAPHTCLPKGSAAVEQGYGATLTAQRHGMFSPPISSFDTPKHPPSLTRNPDHGIMGAAIAQPQQKFIARSKQVYT